MKHISAITELVHEKEDPRASVGYSQVIGPCNFKLWKD